MMSLVTGGHVLVVVFQCSARIGWASLNLCRQWGRRCLSRFRRMMRNVAVVQDSFEKCSDYCRGVMYVNRGRIGVGRLNFLGWLRGTMVWRGDPRSLLCRTSVLVFEWCQGMGWECAEDLDGTLCGRLASGSWSEKAHRHTLRQSVRPMPLCYHWVVDHLHHRHRHRR